jgi:hypothetical protein
MAKPTMSSWKSTAGYGALSIILAFAGFPHQGCGLAASPTSSRRMPSLQDAPQNIGKIHSKPPAYGPKQNHPTAYDENPPFKGPLSLENTSSPDLHRHRIKRYYEDPSNKLQLPTYDHPPKLAPSSSTEKILNAVVDHLAFADAPVDAKEVAESVEFYLRTSKRLLGAAKRLAKSSATSVDGNTCVVVQDLCCGHGLTGMLFAACNPHRSPASVKVATVLVDQFEPGSHRQLRETITEVCPWIKGQDGVRYVPSTLDAYFQEKTCGSANCDASIIISTHACGSLTDDVLQYAIDSNSAAIAVMPCCYTGTDKGTPYGIRRALGVSMAADVRRSFFLQESGYHVDWATIPTEVTPMNRIIVAERRKE